MDLRQLRYFIAIVEQGSFSKASELLNVAQPALSLHVRNLETDLGCALLFRSSQGVVATEAGEILLRNARIIIDQFSLTRHEIQEHEAEPSGEVHLGLPGTIGQILAVPLILEARRQFPKIKVRIAEAMSGFVLEWVREGRIDLAVLYTSVSDRTLTSIPLLSEELWLLGPIKPPAGIEAPGTAQCSYQQVAKLPLVLPSSSHGLRTLLESEAADHALQLNTVIEIDSYTNIKGLVEIGAGYSILPFNSIAREVQSGRLLAWRIGKPKLQRVVNLVYPADRPLTRAVASIEALCRSVLLNLASTGKWSGIKVIR